MVKRPLCGYGANVSAFKLLRGTWKFRFHTIRMLACLKCNGVFDYYCGMGPRTNEVSEFTIKVKPGGRH